MPGTSRTSAHAARLDGILIADRRRRSPTPRAAETRVYCLYNSVARAERETRAHRGRAGVASGWRFPIFTVLTVYSSGGGDSTRTYHLIPSPHVPRILHNYYIYIYTWGPVTNTFQRVRGGAIRPLPKMLDMLGIIYYVYKL